MIWLGFVMMAVLWTTGALAVTGLLHWGAGLVESAHGVELGQAATGLSVPAWLTRWFDIGTIHAALDNIVWALDWMQQAWPWVGAMLQWLVPLTWVLWCLGLALMLLLAGAAHALVRRFRPAATPQRTALP